MQEYNDKVNSNIMNVDKEFTGINNDLLIYNQTPNNYYIN